MKIKKRAKNLIRTLVLIGIFSFAAPIIAEACNTIVLTCSGQSHYVIVCDWIDINTWIEIYCSPV